MITSLYGRLKQVTGEAGDENITDNGGCQAATKLI